MPQVFSRLATDALGDPRIDRTPRCLVAIPAQNEEELLPQCLAALAVQRDYCGSPLPTGTFAVLLLANNCTDTTVATAQRLADDLPFVVHLHDVALPPAAAHAGGARKAAMDEAAFLLLAGGRHGYILTTDADTAVAPTWVSANLEALAAGADAVAGYVDPAPSDYLALGAAFMARGKLEDTYLRLTNEIWALLDPVPHDPWPNHRMNAGASLAVSLEAYLEVDGMPLQAVGEDAAFVRRLERAGRRVRHSLDVRVTTSCRLDGRADAGAAATMKARAEDVEADCDAEMEGAVALTRRALWKGRMRRRHAVGRLDGSWPSAAGRDAALDASFVDVWDVIEATHRRLRRGPPLRPRDLPLQIRIAERLLTRLRRRSDGASEHPGDIQGGAPGDELDVPAAWHR